MGKKVGLPTASCFTFQRKVADFSMFEKVIDSASVNDGKTAHRQCS